MVEIAVCALAARTGLVALAVAGETLVAASQGLAAEDLPAALSFCDAVMRGPGTTFVVEATGEGSGETALPAPAAAACFRAGAAIRSAGGAVLGALCVMDPAPRAGVGEDQAALLTALARLAGAEVEKGHPTLAGEYGHETELSFRHLFEMSPNMMWVFDDETLRFLAVNEAVCERFGYSREEFLRLTIFDVRPAEERGRLRALRDGYDRQSEAYNAETWVFLTKTGERFQGDCRATPLCLPAGPHGSRSFTM